MSGGGWGVGPKAGVCDCWRDRAYGSGARVGSALVLALPAGLGVCGTVCVHARVCVEGLSGVYLRMLWAVIVPVLGAGYGPAPAQSLLRGDVFQTGFLRRRALLQPELEGGAPPPQASRNPGGPGTADRHLREEGGAHSGGVQRPAADEAKMGRLRQIDREVEVARQAEMGKRGWEERWRKGQRRGGRRVIEKRDRQIKA